MERNFAKLCKNKQMFKKLGGNKKKFQNYVKFDKKFF